MKSSVISLEEILLLEIPIFEILLVKDNKIVEKLDSLFKNTKKMPKHAKNLKLKKWRKCDEKN